MALIIRGILWFGLYVFLALLPLGTAVISNPNRGQGPLIREIAVGAGFVGYALMALEFALISRVKAAAMAFGEDALQLFHNLMGIAALALLVAHPVLLIHYGYPANCWLNPFAGCANTATRTAAISLYVLILLVALSVLRKRLGINYEAWYVTHGLFALFVVIASLNHVFVIGRYSTTAILEAMWLLYAAIVTGLIIWYKIWTPLRNWSKPWEVVENREERGDSRTLVLKPVGHVGFDFQPGQFCWLKIGRTPLHMGQHPISMSSAGDVPPGGDVSFTIKNLGDWSGEQVPAMKPGDRMWLDGPHGVFSSDREQGMGYVMIGGGVGITPLYSMCQTMAQREDVRPVVLFYGSRDLESATFREELVELEGRMNLNVIYVLSKPPEGWEGESGYVKGEILSRYLPKQYKRFVYLICGPEQLMDAMEQALPELGVPWEHVQTERFDMV